MWLHQFRRIHRATVPTTRGSTVGHGRRRKGLAPVLRSRVTVGRLLLLLFLASIVLMFLGINPYRAIATGMVVGAGTAMIRSNEDPDAMTVYALVVIAGIIALTIV